MNRDEEDILARIKERFPRMSKSHKVIAEYIVERTDEAVFMTAARLGKALGISESTVVRFALTLGYDGYPELQKALEAYVKGRLNLMQKMENRYGRGTQSKILSSVINSDIENLQDTLQKIDPVAFEAAVGDILEADTVYIMGLRSEAPLAAFLHFYLNMIRPNVVLLSSTNISETFEQMIRIHEGDCFIGISFPRYSMRTLKAMEFANDRNANIIAITDNIHSPMNLYSSCNLLAKSEAVSVVDSLVAPLSVINALVAAMCMRRPEEVKLQLDRLKEAWDNYQIYMQDEINAIDEETLKA